MKKSTIPQTHLFNERDLHLYELQNIYTACSLWLTNGMENQIATYDLTVRDLPPNRNFLLFGGLEEIIEGIRKWRYSPQEINYLKKIKLATPQLAKYLKDFKFSGDVWAMPEGTAFFPGEPVLRITAPICEGNLLTMFLINALTSNTVFMSKTVRCVLAAKNKRLIAGGGMRAQSFESAMKGTRAGYILGAAGGIPAFFRKYNLTPPPISINAYHAVIKSFPSEIAAMRAAGKLFPNNSRPMVDTYNFKQGIRNVIKVSGELRKKNGGSIAAITIDSGDLHQRAVYARQQFDQAGFSNIKITIASNMDEFKIQEHIKKNTPLDTFLVVTALSSSIDAPKLETVYKLAELKKGKKTRPVCKFAVNKISYPGCKQVFRQYKNGRMQKDIIGLANEKLGQPLLIKMISKGKIIYKLPQLDKIKEHTKKQLNELPANLKKLEQQPKYQTCVSRQLLKLTTSVKNIHS